MQKETPGTDKIRPRTKSPSHKMRARQKETDQHVSHYLFIYLPYYKFSLSSRLICLDSVRFIKFLLGQTTTPGTTFPTPTAISVWVL